MERQKKVVDASVIVKLFLHEEKSDEAIGLINKHVGKEVLIIAPELIFLEVLNALRFKEKNKEKLNSVNKALWGLQLLVEPLNQFILEKAISISLEYNLTIYDAIYAAIAQINGCPLITVDEKLKKFPNVSFL